MFALRGIDGELFRGSLEHLLRTHRVLRVPHERGVQQDYEEAAALVDEAVPHERRSHTGASAYSAVPAPPVDRGPVYQASQVMSRGVLTVPAGADVERAWRALTRRGVGQAPVVNADQHLVGLVSRANLLHVLNEQQGNVSHVLARTVADVMDTPVVAVEPTTDVRRIARVMLEYGLPALPVIEAPANTLIGIVSRGDILRVVVSDPPLTLWA